MDRLYERCLLCPRKCGVNRSAGERGFCGENAELRAASASIHRGEEPSITGRGGSGVVFITGCNLGCVFCQNRQISHTRAGPALGRAVDSGEFARICLKLQEMGAENINIVTGSHAVPVIIRGIRAARSAGLKLPVLWNSSAYEGLEALALLEDVADVYLPDLKTLDAGLASRFFNAPDYPDCAARAILQMLKVRGELRYRNALLVSGVMIRHLVLPGCLESTRRALRWFADHAQGRALLSLMTQYTPMHQDEAPAPGRFLNEAEYETVLGWLEEFGIEDGFCQGLVPGNGWLPDFSRQNPFSSALSVPVWHWSGGYSEYGQEA